MSEIHKSDEEIDALRELHSIFAKCIEWSETTRERAYLKCAWGAIVVLSSAVDIDLVGSVQRMIAEDVAKSKPWSGSATPLKS